MAAISTSIPVISQPQFTAMNKPQCFYNQSIVFFYNRSGKHLATEWNTISKLVMRLGVTVYIFIVLANLLVMVAIYVNCHFHFPIYYLMANLAAADFFAGLAYFYLMFNTGPNTQRLKVSTWVLHQGLIDNSLMASLANLLAIAINRHITVFHMQLCGGGHCGHLKYGHRMSNCAIPSVDWNCICDTENCSNMPLLVFWAIFNLVTFVVMVVLCAHISGYVCQRTMRMSQHSSGPQWNRDTIMNVCYPQCSMLLAYEKLFLLLAEFNSAMNPIIYSYHGKEMSTTFSENSSGPTEGSDCSASYLNYTILAGVHSKDHSVV
uniref:Lysophosphatidic acid receptor 1 n=1 Tax=Saimiri boliviensis boliviensis TaxID=39432 RepID=A0A2K6SK38_SAIBB